MRGGKRAGAGRPRGAPAAKQAAALAREARANGQTPLQYMLNIMAADNEPQERRDWAASQALPFLHPRLSATHVSATGNGDALIVRVIKFSELDEAKTIEHQTH